jgi:NAD(P)-dependent dehydrogenase (short-subunit alcohol dehydrogenase family)
MDLGLQGKKAVVSGSTLGIGFATARALAREGAEVVINGRSRQRVEEAVARLRAECPQARVEGVAADLSTAEGCEALVRAVPQADVLVNNLGIFAVRPFEEIRDEEWRQFFEVNVLSGVRLSRHYAKGMAERGWGRIVFVSSESALHIPTEMVHYGMTKTAQLAVARGLAETLAGTGVTVNSVLPGPTRSEGVARFLEEAAKAQGVSVAEVEQEFFRTLRPTSLLRRFTQPDEVAAMIVYVCSAAASATTGAALRVDGGVVRSIV